MTENEQHCERITMKWRERFVVQILFLIARIVGKPVLSDEIMAELKSATTSNCARF